MAGTDGRPSSPCHPRYVASGPRARMLNEPWPRLGRRLNPRRSSFASDAGAREEGGAGGRGREATPASKRSRRRGKWPRPIDRNGPLERAASEHYSAGCVRAPAPTSPSLSPYPPPEKPQNVPPRSARLPPKPAQQPNASSRNPKLPAKRADPPASGASPRSRRYAETDTLPCAGFMLPEKAAAARASHAAV